MATLFKYTFVLTMLVMLAAALPPSVRMCTGEDEPSIATAADSIASDGDVWRPDCHSQSWDLITMVQRYPLYCSKEPEWQALSQHNDPYVRAAVALGIGRTKNPKLIQTLRPLLHDEWALTRKCGLWALLQMKSPLIKEPLLDVVASWDRLGSDLLITHDRFLYTSFENLGLSTRLLSMFLPERQAWLKNFDVSAWSPVFKAPVRDPYWGGNREIIISFEKSHWNGGTQVKMRLQTHRPEGGRAVETRIRGIGDWFAINTIGNISNVNEYALRSEGVFRCFIESQLIRLDPNGNADIEENLTGTKPLLPGIYVFFFYGDVPHTYYLARVQRSEQFEKTIPELLENIGTIQLLGEQRVKAAVPKLIEIFRENGTKSDNPINFIVAEAFARIGDSCSIPVLLDYPHLRDWDVLGDTSITLKEFGDLAYPYYEQRILSWQDTLTRYISVTANTRDREEHTFQSEEVRQMLALEISLRMLGLNGSEQVDQARLNLVDKLTEEFVGGKYERDLPVLVVFRAAVLALAPNYPDRITEVIWKLRDSREIFGELLSELRKPDLLPAAKPVSIQLWQRLQKEPQNNPEFEKYLKKILAQVAPELLAENLP